MSTSSASIPAAVVEKRARRLPTVAALAAAIIPAVIVSDAASYLIATVAHAAGVSHSFGPLQFATYTFLIVDGVVAGAIGWQVLRNRVSNPSRLLSRLVPAVLALSFVPDVLIGITHSEKATTWGGVIALMCMHVVVAAAAVAGYTRFLPVPKPSEAV